MPLVNEIDTTVRHLVSWASTINPWYCVIVVLVVLSLEASLLVGLLLPGDVVMLLAVGALGVEWAVPLFATAVLANLLGQTGGYWLGRTVGPGIRRTWVGRKVGERRWAAAESVLRGSGARALIATRFVAFVHAVVPVVVGTLRLDFRRFIGLAMLGAVLWAAALTALAVLLGEAARVVGYGWTTVLFVPAGVVTAVVILVVSNHKRRAGTG